MDKIALDLDEIESKGLPNFKFSGSSVGDIIYALLPFIFSLAGILLLFFLIMGGLGLMTSKGDQKAVQVAKGRITFALLGFAIVFVSYWLVQLVGLIFNIEAIKQIF